MSHWESRGKSDDWYTPPCVFEALGCQFDLDVAAPPEGPVHVPAARWLSENSLGTLWCGFVWMNPPFGARNGVKPWLDKFISNANGIALVPDRTSALWFQETLPHIGSVLFTRKIRFLRPDGSEGIAPSNGTALMAIGSCGESALTRAAEKGFGVRMAPLDDRYDQ